MVVSCSHRNHRLAGEDSCRIHRHRHVTRYRRVVTKLTIVVPPPSSKSPVRKQSETVLIAASNLAHGFFRKYSRVVHQHRSGAVNLSLVAQLPGIIIAPGQQAGIRPLQHQIVAVAAIVVCNELIGDAVVFQQHPLTVRKIAKSAADEAGARVIDHHQIGTRRRSESKRERCGISAGDKTFHGKWHRACSIEGENIRHARHCHRVGIADGIPSRSNHHGNHGVAGCQADGSAGGSGCHRDLIDFHSTAGIGHRRCEGQTRSGVWYCDGIAGRRTRKSRIECAAAWHEICKGGKSTGCYGHVPADDGASGIGGDRPVMIGAGRNQAFDDRTGHSHSAAGHGRR